jgi:hypothetical protein
MSRSFGERHAATIQKRVAPLALASRAASSTVSTDKIFLASTPVSYRAHTLHTTLSVTQEAIVLSLRQSLYLPLDDLLYITRQYINAAVSRAGLARLLKREGMSRLEDVIPKAEGETISAKKTFKDYEPGFVHIDIKYLPQMPDETSRRYLFVAIDRATRWYSCMSTVI